MSGNIFLQALKVDQKEANTYAATIGNDHRYGESSLAVHTALEYVKTTLKRPTVQHCTRLHAQFLKPVDKSELQLQVEQSTVGKAIAKLRVILKQKGTTKVTVDVDFVDASANRGVSFDTDFKLEPAPVSADLSKFDEDKDAKWVKYHLPYSKTSQGLPLAHWNLFFTRDGPIHPRIHDMWCQLYNPDSRITTVMLPIVADSYLRMADNYIPKSDFSYDAIVARAKRSINGDVRQEDLNAAVMMSWTATQAMSLEIVRQLPAEGVKRVLLRAEGKVIKDGRLVAELTILDEDMNVVAIGQGVDLIIPAQKWVQESRRTKTGAQIMKI